MEGKNMSVLNQTNSTTLYNTNCVSPVVASFNPSRRLKKAEK
jgi:hypothetical protein